MARATAERRGPAAHWPIGSARCRHARRALLRRREAAYLYRGKMRSPRRDLNELRELFLGQCARRIFQLDSIGDDRVETDNPVRIDRVLGKESVARALRLLDRDAEPVRIYL